MMSINSNWKKGLNLLSLFGILGILCFLSSGIFSSSKKDFVPSARKVNDNSPSVTLISTDQAVNEENSPSFLIQSQYGKIDRILNREGMMKTTKRKGMMRKKHNIFEAKGSTAAPTGCIPLGTTPVPTELSSSKGGRMMMRKKSNKSEGKGSTEAPSFFCSEAPSMVPTTTPSTSPTTTPTTPTTTTTEVPTTTPTAPICIDWTLVQEGVTTGGWVLSDGGLTLRFNVEDSANCGGSNGGEQSGTATATIVLQAPVTFTATLSGAGEGADSGFDSIQLLLDTNLIAQAEAAGGGNSCTTVPAVITTVLPQPIALAAGTYTFEAIFTTGDGLEHVDSFYEISLGGLPC